MYDLLLTNSFNNHHILAQNKLITHKRFIHLMYTRISFTFNLLFMILITVSTVNFQNDFSKNQKNLPPINLTNSFSVHFKVPIKIPIEQFYIQLDGYIDYNHKYTILTIILSKSLWFKDQKLIKIQLDLTTSILTSSITPLQKCFKRKLNLGHPINNLIPYSHQENAQFLFHLLFKYVGIHYSPQFIIESNMYRTYHIYQFVPFQRILQQGYDPKESFDKMVQILTDSTTGQIKQIYLHKGRKQKINFRNESRQQYPIQCAYIKYKKTQNFKEWAKQRLNQIIPNIIKVDKKIRPIKSIKSI